MTTKISYVPMRNCDRQSGVIMVLNAHYEREKHTVIRRNQNYTDWFDASKFFVPEAERTRV